MLASVALIAAAWTLARNANLPGIPAADPPRAELTRALENLPLYFVENRGQSDARVSHYIAGKDKTIFFTPTGVSFVLNAAESRWTVALDFVGAAPVTPTGLDQTRAVISYFRGPREQWIAGAPTFTGLRYANLWPGIDLDYAGARGLLKYTFNVAPGADPGMIRLVYRGAESVRLTEAGGISVSTPAGSFDDSAPVAWQDIDGERIDVPVRFVLEPGDDASVARFALGEYDPAHALVIDPAVLVYAGFIGGSGQEGQVSGTAHDIAVDSAGNAYVVGATPSSAATFPVTVGPDLTSNGSDDVFVAKVNSVGTALVYAGYIGGLIQDYGYGIAVDSSGAAYVTGQTSSGPGFPEIVGPDLSYATSTTIGDAFVAKVNPAGTALDYCGYIGGTGADRGLGIAVDGTGAAYVVGRTSSTDLPVLNVPGSDLTYNGGAFDVFVAKVKPDGTGFDYLGYLGGSGDDIGNAIAVDTTGAIYVTGSTASTEATFPVTGGSLDSTYNGGATDAFVAKVNAAGTALDYAGYLGGSADDSGNGIAVDGSGAAYVAGDTNSNQTTFPVTAGSFDTTFNSIGGSNDAFVAKINTAGTALVYAGYIGGNGIDGGADVAVSSSGDAYVTGAAAAGLPVSEGPDLTYNNGIDAFVARINSAGSALVYAGYIGGGAQDLGYGIAVDGAGDAYVSGRTCSSEATFPVTAGPDLTYNGACDDFVARINFVPAPTPNSNVVPTAIDFGAVGVGANATQTVTVTNSGNATLTLGALGNPAAPFTRTGGSCVNNQALAPNASCTIDVQFAPTLAGAAAGSFNIPSDDPDAGAANGQNNVLVSLSGSGTAAAIPNINVNPVTINFGTVNVGANASQTVTISNSGAAALTLGTIGTPAAPFTRTGGTCANGQTLASAASCTITLQFAPAAAGAAASSFNIPSNDPDAGTANGQNNALVSLGGSGQVLEADLVLAVSAAPNPAIPGSPLTYTFTVTNLGPANATSVDLSDVLPAGVSFVSATPSQGGCSGTATVTCNLGALAGGASATVDVVVIPSTTGTLANTASVTSAVPDPNGANNPVTATTPVGLQADLSVAVTSVPHPAVVGERITYTITVANNGPQAASGVTLNSTLPTGVIPDSATASQGNCTIATSVTCTVGNLANDVLAPGASAVVTIVVTPDESGALDHSVSVSAAEIDPDPANNGATTSVPVLATPAERVAAAALGVELILLPLLAVVTRRRRAACCTE